MRRYELDRYVAQMDMGDTIQHYGVLGQKWGVRNYQNKDGSLTSKGRKHYSSKTKFAEKRGRLAGKMLSKTPFLFNGLAAVKAYSGTRGTFRTRTGAQRKAAYIKGMHEGRSGKALAKSTVNKLQDQMNAAHRASFKRDLTIGVLSVGAQTIGSGVALAGLGTANPALYGTGVALSSAGRLGDIGGTYYDIFKRADSTRTIVNSLPKTKRR